jgi:hypothetical protein
MSEADDPRLGLVVGGRSIGANLDAAIERGALARDAEGRLRLAERGYRRTGDAGDAGELAEDTSPAGASLQAEAERGAGFLYRRRGEPLPCAFLNHFLFGQAYARAAVPLGCGACFKVKISTRTLRALMSAREIAERTDFTTKSGAQVDNPTNDSVYSTYIYVSGLEAARAVHASLRPQIDADPNLGAGVGMTVKRGCSNYERKCGPSDRYTFDPGLGAAEAYLAERFVSERPPKRHAPEAVAAMRMLRLVQIAYRIGDPTYKDFTDGKPLFPPSVDHAAKSDPDPAGAEG